MQNDITPRNYQDDLDTSKPDKFANEQQTSPAELFAVPEEKMKQELDNIALDESEHNNEDMREAVEDLDENDNNAASNL